jgi:uncharacterized oxidoreductase
MTPNENTALIGFALAKRLIGTGNTVIICGRDQAKLDAACARLPQLTALRADVTNETDREALLAHIRQRFPKFNVLVNNAGIIHVSDLTNPAHIHELQSEIATNLLAPVALTTLFLPTLRVQPSAIIVNITTGYVFLPSARAATYSATKTALHVMTRALRFQLRSTNVRVVEVMPPAVDTAMALSGSGRKLSPDTVANIVLRGLTRGDKEIAIGLSRVGKFLGRVAPELAFTLMNRR